MRDGTDAGRGKLFSGKNEDFVYQNSVYKWKPDSKQALMKSGKKALPNNDGRSSKMTKRGRDKSFGDVPPVNIAELIHKRSHGTSSTRLTGDRGNSSVTPKTNKKYSIMSRSLDINLNETTPKTNKKYSIMSRSLDINLNETTPATNLDKTRNILSIINGEDDDELMELPSPKRPRQDKGHPADEIKKQLEEKFQLPPILYKQKMVRKIRPYMSVVEQILKGKVISPYYNDAKSVFQKSKRPFVTAEELSALDVHDFTAGFYGLKRQICIGNEILQKFGDQLSNHPSPTIKWWGVKDFATYVLAPEVLALLAIEELKQFSSVYSTVLVHAKKRPLTDFEWQELENARFAATEVFDATADYGLQVTDMSPLEQWEAAAPSNS
ncbi:Rtc4p KNAG_0F00610 [Huiozyma naganishii CBS 8797]|uniref:Restriction of telomere capping protein 4 n=1 Tax=Huiozyma naganishii (strain ATCC MYA-139 / BCRC 22969 / CBS 8797 / KCTC 17520 / NBRC 10181 / NCYC 3082 / Yp74L-3) TaxID=1071383 RepID=J7R791_HUIN7|nr:hypothetical protein KNAG_0F00610 [Kazachstania naganishii CBS 8797]CCK70730.1 hypothetical protein KNAG_0F00610 [Kazachstania naganishii CBS 8797]